MQLILCSQVLEDRVKEVEEFFKSDDEDESVPCVTDAIHGEIKKDQVEAEAPPIAEQEIRSAEPAADCNESTLEPMANLNHDSVVQDVPLADATVGASDVSSSATAAVEAALETAAKLESPKVVEDSPDLFPELVIDSHKEHVANLKRISIANVPKPSLHGRPGQVIDLNDGDTSSAGDKGGVNSLIERFVQQVSGVKKSPRKKEVVLR